MQAYLDVDGIVALAKEKAGGRDPSGYGFLSENAALPRACEEAGITFVGPSAELLELLGDKTAARKLAEKAGVPIVPGTENPSTDPSEAEAARPKHRVSADHQGGVRRRRARHAGGEESWRNCRRKLAEARQEAGAAFGKGAVFLERYIQRAQHIEVQILGDSHGNLVHLFERDCSVQRRHQKVVELAPAVSLPRIVRRRFAKRR